MYKNHGSVVIYIAQGDGMLNMYTLEISIHITVYDQVWCIEKKILGKFFFFFL